MVSSANEDACILYGLFKEMGKLMKVDELKKQFYFVFLKDDADADKTLIEARFWDSITTLQYLGFLSLDDTNVKVTKMDFALCPVSNKHSKRG